MLIARAQVFFIDWPWARIGAPFVEWLAVAPSGYMQHGPKPEELLRMVPLAAVDDSGVNAVIASLTCYFLGYSRRPPPPGIPTVPGFQAAPGQNALQWR